jgi:uncharacterized protein
MRNLLYFLTAAMAFSQESAEMPLAGAKIVAAARQQAGVTVRYDPAYVALAFPMGDVPTDRGVCTDVVVRALRTGLGMDLQALVNSDMKKNFESYPTRWGLKKPDPNIDHRRVPNLQKFFERRGESLPVSRTPSEFLPGDLVTCTVPPNLPHIMIVSDQKASDGKTPLVLHNIGAGAVEEDCLLRFAITGHYRLKTKAKSSEKETLRPREGQSQ